MANANRVYRFNAVRAVADLPDPSTVEVGTRIPVVNDPLPANNGDYIAVGADPGQPAVTWIGA